MRKEINEDKCVCAICGKVCASPKSKAAHMSSHSIKRNKFRELYEQNPKTCPYCGKIISWEAHKKERKFCNSAHAALYNNSKRTPESRQKQAATLKSKLNLSHKKISNKKKIKNKTCICCGNNFVTETQRKTCSLACERTLKTLGARKGGLISVGVQSKERRSKNEKLFAEMCIKDFSEVLTNELMFNGWDADVILPKQKIAILWNGKWHYEQIKKGSSLSQIQNRDKIKIKEITKMGYTSYVIKDMGKYNPEFVKSEYEKFIKIINRRVSCRGRVASAAS